MRLGIGCYKGFHALEMPPIRLETGVMKVVAENGLELWVQSHDFKKDGSLKATAARLVKEFLASNRVKAVKIA